MNDVFWELFAGSVGGGIGMLVGHPLDTIKVRMMTRPDAYLSMRDCFMKTVQGEGAAGFFKGVAPPMLSVAVYQAVCFASFSSALAFVTEKTERDASIPSLFLAGSISGAATVLVTTPTDLVKIRLQLETETSTRRKTGVGGLSDMFRCARGILATEGMRGFYRGIVATAYRDTWSTGLYFVVYHGSKRCFSTLGDDVSDVSSLAPSVSKTPPWVELTAGGLAGVIAWGSVVPFDVVKTRLQSQTHTQEVPSYSRIQGNCRASSRDMEWRFWPTFSNIVRREGWLRLYSGTIPLLARAFAVNAVTFYTYEETWRWIGR